MWGNIYVDYSLHRNFNVGFSSHKNNIHLHLSQWQYWWWFWFALLWSLYFLVILRTWINKTENFNISVNTSLRSHGKWGDFLVALIPLSWCGNILINSNFILRMIEWQNEASLFTIRIQGKQWYWVYKYNSDTNYRLMNVYINVGNNNWFKTISLDKLDFNYHNSTILYVHEYEFKKLFKKSFTKNKITKNYLKSLNLNSQFNNFNNFNNNLNVLWNYKFYYTGLRLSNNNNLNTELIEIKNLNNIKLNPINNLFNSNELKLNKLTYKLLYYKKNFINNIFNVNKTKFSNYESNQIITIEDADETLKIKQHNFPIKLIKGVLNKNNIELLKNTSILQKNILFNYKINNKNLADKVAQPEQFWGFRQKKYKKLRSYFFLKNNKYNNKTYSYIENFVNNNTIYKYNLYNNFKTNKNKSELIPSTLAKRLLRTKRTLVLPAHINITLITGSYDVVHSWFIPGLGLKMDCVPGRSTHHSLYIDNIGFYYGQCAEICGRYHHHMPIRVCALNYNHFLLWWQTKGLPRMYRSQKFLKNKSILLTKFKY